VTASGTNSGGTSSRSGGANGSGKVADKGKGKRKSDQGRKSEEADDETPKPQVITPELRELLSRKVEVLPRKVVRKEGEGRSSLTK
jgi:hypothetical protein